MYEGDGEDARHDDREEHGEPDEVLMGEVVHSLRADVEPTEDFEPAVDIALSLDEAETFLSNDPPDLNCSTPCCPVSVESAP